MMCKKKKEKKKTKEKESKKKVLKGLVAFEMKNSIYTVDRSIHLFHILSQHICDLCFLSQSQDLS